MIPSSPDRPSWRFRMAWATSALALLVGAPAVAEPLTLAQALARAAASDPSADASTARVTAAQAGVRQAGVRINPVISGEVENVPTTGNLPNQAQATVFYEQILEPTAKRQGRVGHARALVGVARLRGEVRRLDLIRDVQVAYVEALSAEVRALLAESSLAEAEAARADIDKRVRSARDPLFAGARANAQTAQALIARDQARAGARNARAVLAAFWGGGAEFELDPAVFFQVSVADALDSSPAPSPDLLLLAAERDAAAAAVQMEQARVERDVTVRGGLRFIGQGNDLALVVGGSIPLRRYDRNEGAIARAQAERTAAEVEIAAARTVQARDVARLSAKLATAAAESDRIAAEVIPAAAKAVELVRAGFNRGGFQYIDVTEAQRALIAARTQRIDILRQFHLDQAALDRLTGRHAALAVLPGNAP